MNEVKTLSIHWTPELLKIIDQTQLPQSEVWLSMNHLEDFLDAIKKLKIRGAPLIGVSAALFIATEANKGTSKSDLLNMALVIRKSRPTAVNLMVCVDKIVETIRSETSTKDSI
ncbi:MAG: hypothetical protein KDD45_17110, partial [Bdellovibrionales bacterium]|nr:hypothetical protein [Bdellovibrionales bacterium]